MLVCDVRLKGETEDAEAPSQLILTYLPHGALPQTAEGRKDRFERKQQERKREKILIGRLTNIWIACCKHNFYSYDKQGTQSQWQMLDRSSHYLIRTSKHIHLNTGPWMEFVFTIALRRVAKWCDSKKRTCMTEIRTTAFLLFLSAFWIFKIAAQN